MKNNKDILTTVILVVIFIFTLILFRMIVPFNRKGLELFIVYLFLVFIIYKFWIITTYGFICRNCGYEFKIGLTKRFFSFENKKSCPLCNSKDLIEEGIRNYYFEKWADIDED